MPNNFELLIELYKKDSQSTEFKNLNEEAQKAILSGFTSGNSTTDFVIGNIGYNPNLIAEYRDIEKKLVPESLVCHIEIKPGTSKEVPFTICINIGKLGSTPLWYAFFLKAPKPDCTFLVRHNVKRIWSPGPENLNGTDKLKSWPSLSPEFVLNLKTPYNFNGHGRFLGNARFNKSTLLIGDNEFTEWQKKITHDGFKNTLQSCLVEVRKLESDSKQREERSGNGDKKL